MRGVAGDSLTLFLLLTDAQWDKLMTTEYMTERLKILQDIADQIYGVGNTTVDSYLPYIELVYAELHKK
jgi:hypothetical protein